MSECTRLVMPGDQTGGYGYFMHKGGRLMSWVRGVFHVCLRRPFHLFCLREVIACDRHCFGGEKTIGLLRNDTGKRLEIC